MLLLSIDLSRFMLVEKYSKEFLLTQIKTNCRQALVFLNYTKIDLHSLNTYLLLTLHDWSFNAQHKKEPWKLRDKPMIVWVWTWFCEVTKDNSFTFESFFLSELLLYKPFRNIHIDIGINTEIIIHNWRKFRYRYWNVNKIPLVLDTIEEYDDTYKYEINN